MGIIIIFLKSWELFLVCLINSFLDHTLPVNVGVGAHCYIHFKTILTILDNMLKVKNKKVGKLTQHFVHMMLLYSLGPPYLPAKLFTLS